MTPPAAHKNGHLSPRACFVLGGIAGTVGLAASGVATWLYTLGVIELEPSGTGRTALIAVGVLLTVGQLAASGIAAAARGLLLPSLRRTLLVLAAALFLFETGSMALTQMALVQTADVAAGAAAARAAELQHAIEARRATAARQRDLADTQAQAQAITAAARSLRAAEASEATIEPLAAELAKLQAERRPTLSTLLGSEQHVALFATARAALIALVGLVMTSTAGALFRAARGAPAALTMEQAQPHQAREERLLEPQGVPLMPGFQSFAQGEHRRLHTPPVYREPRRSRSRDSPAVQGYPR